MSLKRRMQKVVGIFLYIPSIFCNLLLLVIAGASSVEQCCREQSVPDICVRTLCNPGMPPGDFAIYDIFDTTHNCSRHLGTIAQCLTMGRDNYDCCSQEAKDLDENACFGLCRGEGDFQGSSAAAAYQTCIALNLPSMFTCFEKGYRESPSFPRNVKVERVTATEVELSWEEPEFNAALVDHYLLFLYEMEPGSESPELETEMRVETVSRNARIGLLEPGTSYLLQISALGVGADDAESEDSNEPRSLPAEKKFKTNGAIPQVKPFKEKTLVALNSDTVIACRIRISRGLTPEIKWEHKAEKRSHFHPISQRNARIDQGHYEFSRFRPRELLATLQIRGAVAEDFGHYKCKVSDVHGESEATLQLLPIGSVPLLPRESPPDTPLQCCERLQVQHHCLTMCGTKEENAHKYKSRPSINHNCSGEITKVLSCAMTSVDESICCITKKMPSQCLYLCDHQQKPVSLMPPICVDFIAAAEECRIAGLLNRPDTIRNLKAHTSESSNSISVHFERASRADRYFIYWRHQSSGQWHHKVVSSNHNNKLAVSAAEELVVVAANAFGLSQAARLRFQENGRWVRV